MEHNAGAMLAGPGSAPSPGRDVRAEGHRQVAGGEQRRVKLARGGSDGGGWQGRIENTASLDAPADDPGPLLLPAHSCSAPDGRFRLSML